MPGCISVGDTVEEAYKNAMSKNVCCLRGLSDSIFFYSFHRSIENELSTNYQSNIMPDL